MLNADSSIVSTYLTDLGFSLDNTLQELYELLDYSAIYYLFCNSNASTFNTTLPTSTGGILIIKKPTPARGSITFENYRNGNVYTCGYIDGTLTEWRYHTVNYTLSYPTDLFSATQCRCQRSGNICYVYVSLKTSTSIVANTTITLTGHPIVPLVQYFRTITYGGSDIQIMVSSESIEFLNVNTISSGSWLRFSFSYVCTD